ncbi:hypothetical protein SVIOM74S_08384 [Streptomyces violarus]
MDAGPAAPGAGRESLGDTPCAPFGDIPRKGSCDNQGHGSSSAASGGSTRREATRQKLYEAAVTLIAEQGFSATTVDEIAERAGVAKGTVYYNFASKSVLFEELRRGGGRGGRCRTRHAGPAVGTGRGAGDGEVPPQPATASRLTVLLALRDARPEGTAHRTVVHAADREAELDALFGEAAGNTHPTVTVLRPDDPGLVRTRTTRRSPSRRWYPRGPASPTTTSPTT